MDAFHYKTAAVFLLAAVAAMAQVPPPPEARSNGPAPVLQGQPQISFSGSVGTGTASATPLALSLRDAIQRIALEWPAYGRRRITKELRRRGWTVNQKRVYRLMRDRRSPAP